MYSKEWFRAVSGAAMGEPAGPTVQELKRSIDRLNYFYYLLSHPSATLAERPRRPREARGPELSVPELAVLEPGRTLTEWTPTLTRL